MPVPALGGALALLGLLTGTRSRARGADERGPLLSAHRGGPGDDRSVSTSLAAVAAALDVGVDLVEFDVRVTADGRFVTAHDASIPTSDGGRLAVEQATGAQVLAGGIGAAELDDVLHLVRGRALGHVDLKDLRCEVEIADACEAVLGKDGFVLTTLEDVSVRRLRSARPHLHVALSLGKGARGLDGLSVVRLRLSELFPAERVRACDPTMLAVNHHLARFGVLAWAWRRRIPVLVWTVNNPLLLRRAMRDPRIWAVTTDHPRRALGRRPA